MDAKDDIFDFLSTISDCPGRIWQTSEQQQQQKIVREDVVKNVCITPTLARTKTIIRLPVKT